VTALHPGFYLSELLADRGWTQRELAERMGRSQSSISRVLSGHYPIGPRLALDLEAVFGLQAESWCRLQADYEVARARAQRKAKRAPAQG
jgi:HTH-type transcriptional regulator/antitoxin HigA